MAHSTEHPRCTRCGKKSTCTVFNSRNAPMGAFCTPCGKQKLTEIQRLEQTKW